METTATPQGNGDSLSIKTSEEFRAKYGKKRFVSHTAPKAVLYTFLHDMYQQGEGGAKLPLYPDMMSIQEKVETYEDMDLWNGYLNLVEWQRSAFNTAVFMRNALQSNLSDLDHMIKSLIAAEELRGELRGVERTEAATLWLYSLSIEAYTPQSNAGIIITLRKNVEAGLRYMKAYNTFIELIAEETKTPEYVLLKVSMRRVWETLEAVNEALSMLRETVERNRAEEAKGASAGDLTQWTPEYFRETMKAFEPVGDNIPPVPKDKIQEARPRIKRALAKGNSSWYSVFFPYSSKYWRVDVYE